MRDILIELTYSLGDELGEDIVNLKSKSNLEILEEYVQLRIIKKETDDYLYENS